MTEPKPLKNFESELDRVIGTALADNQFISLQDTNHASQAVQDGLVAMIPTLAKHGVRHLFLELPIRRSYQKRIDDYVSGKIDRDELKASLIRKGVSSWQDSNTSAESFVQIIETATKYGIHVWESDPENKIFMWPTPTNLLGAFSLLFDTKNHKKSYSDTQCNGPLQGNVIKRIFPETASDSYTQIWKERMDINEEVVRLAWNKIQPSQGKQKAAFFWGSGHSDNTVGNNDIDEMAAKISGSKKVFNIAIYPSELKYKCPESDSSAPRDSDYNYFVVDKKIVANQNHSEIPQYANYEALNADFVRQFKLEAEKNKGANR